MSTATAQVCGKSLAHVLLGRPRIAVEQTLCRHDHSTDAIAALNRLLVHERLLQRVRILDRAEPLDRRDLGITNRPDLSGAGARRPAGNQHGTCAALGEPAAEFSAIEREIVAQDVKQWYIRVGRHRAARPIAPEVDGHRFSRPPARPARYHPREPLSRSALACLVLNRSRIAHRDGAGRRSQTAADFSSSTGRHTVKTDPLPASLATVTSPPIMRASLREMARPSPVPP